MYLSWHWPLYRFTINMRFYLSFRRSDKLPLLSFLNGSDVCPAGVPVASVETSYGLRFQQVEGWRLPMPLNSSRSFRPGSTHTLRFSAHVAAGTGCVVEGCRPLPAIAAVNRAASEYRQPAYSPENGESGHTSPHCRTDRERRTLWDDKRTDTIGQCATPLLGF